MRKKSNSIICLFMGIVLCMGLITSGVYANIKQGDTFPKMSIDISAYKEAKKYLNIKKGKEIDVSEIKADLLIVEIMSVYCVSCMSQAPYDRELFTMIEDNDKTAGRVKIIGIGVGNNFREVEKFVKEFNVLYPILPDPQFERYNLIGQVRTPFKIYLRRQRDNQLKVIKTELGVREDVNKTFAGIVDILEGRFQIEEKVEVASTQITPVPQDLVEGMITEWLQQRGMSGGIDRLFTEKGLTVFKIDVQDGLFAILVNRVNACDVCHEVKFIFTMDRQGNVLDLLPIQLSRIYNELFTEQDVAKLKSHLVARNVREQITFNPDVDAITSATITSAAVYDSINMGATIYGLLIEKGYI